MTSRRVGVAGNPNSWVVGSAGRFIFFHFFEVFFVQNHKGGATAPRIEGLPKGLTFKTTFRVEGIFFIHGLYGMAD